jgi:2-C-methyl-D-erythritol 4-phosphate cytidylyltransferase/2-C-methyl-D-erythritol 2,4-cyclodiphosphate synthase
MEKAKVSAVILAAGSAQRMQAGKNKAYIKVGDRSILSHTLTAFSRCAGISEIIIVCREEEMHLAEEEAARTLHAPYKTVPGGELRQQSVANALKVLSPDAEIVLVHDSARCFVEPELIRRCIESAILHGSGCAASSVTDTLKSIEGEAITGTIDRDRCVAIQTPQVFKRELLLKAHEKAEAEGFFGTDESVLVERLGEKVRFVLSKSENIKITTPKDLSYAEFLLFDRKNSLPRIGHGYDMHRLVPGRKLILGGVEIPFEKGLLGHSDADVLVHAAMDALLGAAGLPDIGSYFPPSDAAYKDANSISLLSRVKGFIREAGFSVVNIDCTVVLEAPKIAGYIPRMRENIAGALGLGLSSVNVKATTEEGLGATGRGEGAAAFAVCSLKME